MQPYFLAPGPFNQASESQCRKKVTAITHTGSLTPAQPNTQLGLAM